MSEQKQQQVDSILTGLTDSIGKVSGLIVAVTVAVSAVINFFTSKSWYEIALGLFAVLIVAFVVIRLYRRQQQTARKKKIADISGPAFRGLLPYEEDDSETFFGREEDIGEILLKVRSSDFRFGVLTGESGCGKTSLLRAGLIPKLQEADFLPVYLRLYGDPEQQIRQAVEIQTGVSSDAGETLRAYLQRVSQEKQQTLILCCDQFEEFFINHPDAAFRQTFIEFVARCYKDQTLMVKFLFSLREDFLSKISEFDGVIPEPLAINKRYHLWNFDADQAESIIQRSVDNSNLPFESDLCHTIAQDLLKGNQVLPAELQIVCQQLQRQRIYSTEQYQDSGRKESLVYAFLEDVIKGAGSGGDVKLVLRSMISEEDTKLTQTLAQIAKNSQQSESQVNSILHHFVNARLIREIQEQTPWHYELMHEYLIGKINELSGSVMDAVKRANHIFKQWLNRYQRDHKTLISLTDSRFINRYSDLDRNGSAGELLAKSLRWGWIKAGVMAVTVLGLIAVPVWYFWNDNVQRQNNIGILLINNTAGAKLKLQLVHHYGKDDSQPWKTPEDVSEDKESKLEGPADYKLSAEIEGILMEYPVFIKGYGHSVTITIDPPLDAKEIPAGMAYIPAGTFRMGDKDPDDGGPVPNERAHDVYLDAFLIDKTEVSNKDFAEFMEAGGNENRELWQAKNEKAQSGEKYLDDMDDPKQPRYWDNEDFNQDDHPVVGVSWFEARAYCRWKVKKLPTEAQWEKAARGPGGYEWSFGNTWDDIKTKANSSVRTKANSDEGNDGYAKTAPVDEYQANAYGLYNMSGNVWEWVQDFYDRKFYNPPKNQKGSVKNPVNNQTEGELVLRGGSWYHFPNDIRASVRYQANPESRTSYIGFRCARTL